MKTQGVRVDMSGMKDIKKMLLKMDSKLSNQVITKSMRSGFTRFIKPIAKAGAPSNSGDLKRSIGTETVKKKPKNWVGIWMGARNKNGKFAGWRAGFINFGTVHQPAQPFMSDAFNKGLPTLIDQFSKVLADSMYKFMKSKIKAANKRK